MSQTESLDYLKLENQLCFPFYAASMLITRLYQPHLEALGVTYPQYLVLLVLWENDGVPVGKFTQSLLLNTNTITPLLKRMEASGLVTRKRSSADERQVLIYLTNKGLSLKEKALCIPQKLLEEVNYPLDKLAHLKAEIDQLMLQLSKTMP